MLVVACFSKRRRIREGPRRSTRGRHLGNRQHHLQQQQQQQKAAGNSNRQHAAAQCKQQQPAVNDLVYLQPFGFDLLGRWRSSPAMARAKNALDDNAYQLLLKNHIKSLDDLRFVHRDEEVVVARYQPFLEECARKTSRISVAMLQKAAIDHFGCSQTIAHQFANAMANAFSFCFKKVRSAKSGKKLSNACCAVLMAALGPRSEQCAAKLSALQQNMGCNSSSSSSSSTCFSVLLPTTAQQQHLPNQRQILQLMQLTFWQSTAALRKLQLQELSNPGAWSDVFLLCLRKKFFHRKRWQSQRTRHQRQKSLP